MKQKLVIVGQGYVGLPISSRAVDAGFDVVGFDIDDSKVMQLAAGTSYIEDVADSRVGEMLASQCYLPTSNHEEIAGFDFAIITVPTPLHEAIPDLSYIEAAARTLGPYIRRGSTVVLESTTYPGTTEELLAPLLEAESGLLVREDFFVGYSPERIDPGNQVYRFENTPKVVSGLGADALGKVHDLYSALVDEVIPVSTPKEAELTKLLENTFRHVNIALVNELAVFARDLGIDVWEAIDAASTKPFGYMRFTPGPGVGGHCLPVDPSYLSWQVRRTLGKSFRFVDLANDVNDHMPDYVVQRVIMGLNARERSLKGSTVLALGLAYKQNTADVRESPAVRVVELLAMHGASVVVADPFVDPSRFSMPGVALVSLDEEAVAAADAIVILTDHDGVNYELIEASDAFVLDTRRRLDGRRECL